MFFRTGDRGADSGDVRGSRSEGVRPTQPGGACPRSREGRAIMSDNPPRISVVIPAYNAAAFIRRAIQSALVQTLLPCEIIVVDDGSQDGTAEFVERNFPEVRVFRQQNAGPGSARNHGVREASGDWIGLL